MSTDQLIEKLIKSGIQLPRYEWELKKFASDYPSTINLGQCDGYGIIATEYFDTYQDACKFLLEKLNIK